MATESVVVAAQSNIKYRDPSHFEETDSALRGALALNCILSDMAVGESVGIWTNHVVSDLYEANRLLLRSAMTSLDLLSHENWCAHALLGEYGSEAKARAEAEKAADGVTA